MYRHSAFREPLRWLAHLCALSILATTIARADPPAARPLTLTDAVQAALATSPELRELEFRVRVLDARIDRARLRPPVSVSLSPNYALGTGDFRGMGSSETPLALSSVIELGGKRVSRTRVAEAERSVFDVERSARQLDVLAEVTRRFIAVVEHQERLKSLSSARALAEQTLVGAERRVKAAKSPHVEVDRARLALRRSELDESRAQGELDAARVQLAATWGATEASLHGTPFGLAEADLYRVPDVPEFSELASRLDSTPEFVRFASATRLREAELRLAETERRPDIGISLGVTRLQISRDEAFLASVSVPLFSAARARPAVAEARANLGRIEAEVNTTRVRVTAVLFELHRALTQAARQAEALRTDMLPKMGEALRETQYAYDRGRYSYLELVDAQREYLALEAALISASADAHRLRAEIERLTRLSLTEAPPATEVLP